jgi:hypothetical protein
LTIAPDAKGQFLKGSILKLLGKTLTALEEYGQAYQMFAKGLRRSRKAITLSSTIEILVDIAELLNKSKRESPLR